MTKRELKQKRHELMSEARKFLEERQAAGKYNAGAQKRFDAMMDEAAEVQGEIDALTALEDAEKRAALEPQDVAIKPEIPGSEPQREGEIRFGREGEIRAFRPNEKIGARSYDLPGGIQAGDLSLGRFLRGICTSDWTGAEAERRTMGVGDGSLGGFSVPSPLGDRVLDLARAAARTVQAGALSVPMTSAELTFAKVTADPTAAWYQENASITASDLTFGSVRLRARTLAALVKVSIELMEDAPNFSALIEGVLAQALAVELDRAVLRGDGGDSEPTGIRNATGVNLTDKSSVALDLWDDVIDEAVVLRNANVTGPLTMITSPKTMGVFAKLFDGQGQPLLQPPLVQEIRKLETSQIPANLGSGTDESEIYMGDFSQCFIGMRTQLIVEATRVGADGSAGAFSDKQVWIRAYLRADCAVARPNHLSVIHGFTT